MTTGTHQANPPASNEPKQWAGVVATLALLVLYLMGLIGLGLVSTLNFPATIAIFLMFILICIKISVAPNLSSDGFTFAKQGNDFCQLALSSSLTEFALQSGVESDMLPGARRLFADLHIVSKAPVSQQNIIMVVVLGAASAVGYYLTAYQVGQIRRNRGAPVSVIRAFGCYFIGTLAMSGNIFVLISK